MKIAQPLKLLGLVTVMVTSLYACSTVESEFSPEQVIQNILADSTKMPAYYAESILTFNDENGDIQMKEWVSEDGKRRTETVVSNTSEKAVSVNDGEKLVSYDEANNTAYVIDMSGEEFPIQKSPKEQAEMLLNAIKNTHIITLVGEEKIVGRDVYHLKAEAKDDNVLYGDQEIWVDKENWFVLKSVSSSGDIQVSIEYSEIEFNPTFDDSLFKLELPEDVEITDIASTINEQIVETLDEAITIMEKPFLYVKEENGLTIKQMALMSIEGDSNPELTITYFKDDLPYFSLSGFAVEEENTIFDGEGENIRGFKGNKTDMEGFRLLNWAEDGYGYSVILLHPDLTFEKMNEIINNMEYVQVQ